MEQHNANWKIDKQGQILNKHMRRKIKKEFLILRTVVKETENYFFEKCPDVLHMQKYKITRLQRRGGHLPPLWENSVFYSLEGAFPRPLECRCQLRYKYANVRTDKL